MYYSDQTVLNPLDYSGRLAQEFLESGHRKHVQNQDGAAEWELHSSEYKDIAAATTMKNPEPLQFPDSDDGGGFNVDVASPFSLHVTSQFSESEHTAQNLLPLQFPPPTANDDFNTMASTNSAELATAGIPSHSSSFRKEHHEELQPLQFPPPADDDDFNTDIYTAPMDDVDVANRSPSGSEIVTNAFQHTRPTTDLPRLDMPAASLCFDHDASLDMATVGIRSHSSSFRMQHHEESEPTARDLQPLQFPPLTDDNDFNTDIHTTPMDNVNVANRLLSGSEIATHAFQIPPTDLPRINMPFASLCFGRASPDMVTMGIRSHSSSFWMQHEGIREGSEPMTQDLQPLQFPPATDDNGQVYLTCLQESITPSSALRFPHDSSPDVATTGVPPLPSLSRIPYDGIYEESQPMAQALQFPPPSADNDFNTDIHMAPTVCANIANCPLQLPIPDLQEPNAPSFSLHFTDDSLTNLVATNAPAPYPSSFPWPRMKHVNTHEEPQTTAPDPQPLQFSHPTDDDTFNILCVSPSPLEVFAKSQLVLTARLSHFLTDDGHDVNVGDPHPHGDISLEARKLCSGPQFSNEPESHIQMASTNYNDNARIHRASNMVVNDFNVGSGRRINTQHLRFPDKLVSGLHIFQPGPALILTLQVDGNISDDISDFNIVVLDEVTPVPNGFEQHAPALTRRPQVVKTSANLNYSLSKGKWKSLSEYPQRPSELKRHIQYHEERSDDAHSKYDHSYRSHSHKSVSTDEDEHRANFEFEQDELKPRHSNLIFEDECSDSLREFQNSGNAPPLRQRNPTPARCSNLIFEDEGSAYLEEFQHLGDASILRQHNPLPPSQDQVTTRPDRLDQKVLQVIGLSLEFPDILLNGNIRNPS